MWEEAALAKLGHLIQGQFPRERVETFAEAFLKGSPTSSRVRISYARYLIDQDALGHALGQFRTVLDQDPDNTTALLSAGLLSVQEDEYRGAAGTGRKMFLHRVLTTDAR